MCITTNFPFIFRHNTELSFWNFQSLSFCFELSPQKEVFDLLRPMMRGLVNEVGTAIRNHNGYIYIPVLGKKLEALETA